MIQCTGKTIYVGIDVHKKSYSVSVMCERTLIKRDKLIACPEVLLEYLRKFNADCIKSAYEAGFCGFYLHRILIANDIENIVVNPASIETSAKDCVKTDKRDSLKIATQLADGRLTSVFIPSEKREDKRILTRLRDQFVKARNRTACHIKSSLHLRGLIDPLAKPRVSNKWLKSVEKDKRFSYFTKI